MARLNGGWVMCSRAAARPKCRSSTTTTKYCKVRNSIVVVIPNQGVDLVPNIGIIGGKNAVLVVETGMGTQNAKKVLAFARDYAKGRKLYLTTTHFHPEHAFGAQVFKEEATFLSTANRQRT